MATRTKRTERRTDALSKERIVEAAIEILDTEGESALTFRALTARLATGSGAIYWHVASKDELLAAADRRRHRPGHDRGGSGGGAAGGDPRHRPRGVRRDRRPPLGGHPALPRAVAVRHAADLRGHRQQLQALGVPERAQFDCASALVNYVLGLAGQYAAAAARLVPKGTDRTAFLTAFAAQWAQLDPAQYPFVRRWRRSCPGTTTASSSWPASTSSWPASPSSKIE
jgi:AcrR family transcriptional regulator